MVFMLHPVIYSNLRTLYELPLNKELLKNQLQRLLIKHGVRCETLK